MHSPMSVPHLPPPPGSPSSLVPLQLLSMKSQVSGDGFFVHFKQQFAVGLCGSQLSADEQFGVGLHTVMAPEQAPIWLLHATFSPAGLSSTRPLQSLSLSSQTSGPVGTHEASIGASMSEPPPS